MNKTQPLLSICIPTWNRAKFLRISLESIKAELQNVDNSEIEILVSDNCSDDDTPNLVKQYIADELPITYNRQKENIGAARNFVSCINWASGKYILLLGDDDILKVGAVKMILDNIRGKDYGLIHVHNYANLSGKIVEYSSHTDYIKQISFWITFMSGSIFRKDIVNSIDSEMYVKSHLLQMPFYITSLLSKKQNLLISQDIIEEGLDSNNNGGYNFYEVFVRNYLTIWKEYVDCGMLELSLYEWIKKDIFLNFVVSFNKRFFVYKKDIKEVNVESIGNRAGFRISGANEILNKYYGDCIYYKLYKLKLIYWIAMNRLIKYVMHKN